MIEHKNVHEAINGVMHEVGYVQKQKSEKLTYTYLGEAGLIEALRPSMVNHGIYVSVRKVIKIYRDQYQTRSGTSMTSTVIHGVVRFSHVSGSHIDVEATGEGADSGDKSANKAMTGLYKYAVRQTFMIETGDDPDQFSSEAQERALKPSAKATIAKVSDEKPAEVEEAEVLAGGLSVNELKLAENVVQIKDTTGRNIPEIMKVINSLDKSKKHTIGQVVKAIRGDAE